MYLVQILLPLYDNEREALPRDEYIQMRSELTERFGGLTVYTRAPAEGLWKQNDNQTHQEDIVIFEVMTSQLDTDWWQAYRKNLEVRFRQDMVVIRAQQMRLL